MSVGRGREEKEQSKKSRGLVVGEPLLPMFHIQWSRKSKEPMSRHVLLSAQRMLSSFSQIFHLNGTSDYLGGSHLFSISLQWLFPTPTIQGIAFIEV